MFRKAKPFFKAYISRWFNLAPPGPLFVYLELTKGCNSRCRFCDIWRIGEIDKNELKGQLSFEEIVRLLDCLKKLGTKFIRLYGGEPLLRQDILNIIKAIKDRGMSASISTNGMLITGNLAKELIDSGIDLIILSLDSHRAELNDFLRGAEGAFLKTVQAIDNVIRVNGSFNIFLSTVVTKKNYKELIDLIKFAETLKIRRIMFLPVHSAYPQNIYFQQDEALFFRSEEEIESLGYEIRKVIEYLKKSKIESNSFQYLRNIPNYYRGRLPNYPCYAGYIVCKISSHGYVYPCNKFDPENSKNNFQSTAGLIETIKEKDFKDIWDSAVFDNMRKQIKVCHDCWNNCFIDLSIRYSIFYQFKNFKKTVYEFNNFIQK